MSYHERQFYTAIDIALNNRYDDTDIALLLLQVLHAYGSPVRRNKLDSWITEASRTKDSKIIHQVLALRRHFTCGPVWQFQASCNSGDLATVRMFINEGFVPLRCSSLYEYGVTPIQTATLSKRSRVVEEVLKSGANPNGDYVSKTSGRPLWIAIDGKDEASVKVLLRHGANPGLVMRRWLDEADDYRDARSAIKDLLIEAERKKEYYVCSTTPVTQFAAGAADLISPEISEKQTPEEIE